MTLTLSHPTFNGTRSSAHPVWCDAASCQGDTHTRKPTFWDTEDPDTYFELYLASIPDVGAYMTLIMNTDWASQIRPGAVILNATDAATLGHQLLAHAALLEASGCTSP